MMTTTLPLTKDASTVAIGDRVRILSRFELLLGIDRTFNGLEIIRLYLSDGSTLTLAPSELVEVS